MPSVNEEQVEYLVSRVDNPRDQSILRLLFDSGMRLSEFTNIRRGDINWDSYTITIIGKETQRPIDKEGRVIND